MACGFAVDTVLKCGIQNNFLDQIGFSERFRNCGMNLRNLRMGLKIKITKISEAISHIK